MRALSLAVLLASLASPAIAQTACPEHFMRAAPPKLTNQRLATQARQLCNRAYAVLHSGVTRTPLWSAEHLTRSGVAAARTLQRTNIFDPDGRLPTAERSELADYARSGFDRGHMSPSGDMPDAVAQAESFLLSNMVPQAHRLNAGLWAGIEGAVRDYAQHQGEVYVVTGPAFLGADLQVLRGRVGVPSHVWKAIYVPRTNEAGAYWSPNTDAGGYEAISIARLRELVGVDVFPGLPETVKTEPGVVPAPRQRSHS